MTDTPYRPGRSPLEIGALLTLGTLGLAAVIGAIVVLTADNVASGFGQGLGIAAAIFLTGGTFACAIACLSRGTLELVALSSILVAGLAIDLLVLGIWLDIDADAYGKVVGIAFVWSFFALVALGLTLAVGQTRRLSRSLYVGAVGMCVLAALISTWLVATAEGGEVSASAPPESAFGAASDTLVGDDDLLRMLGVVLVLLAALWFGTLAASRLDRAPEPVPADE
jgi:hypothetical protein